MGLCEDLGSEFKYGQIGFQSEQGELKAYLQLSSLRVRSFASLPGICCFFVSVCCHSALCVFCLHLWLFRQACCPVYIIIYLYMAAIKDRGDRCLHATLSTCSTKPTKSCVSDPQSFHRENAWHISHRISLFIARELFEVLCTPRGQKPEDINTNQLIDLLVQKDKELQNALKTGILLFMT